MGHLARAVVLLVAVLLTGCGEATVGPPVAGTPGPASRPTAVPAAAGEVTTRYAVTVLDDEDSGPQMCLGGVADSFPPQCGGPDLIGWRWADHRGGFETAGGVRWGEFVLTGTFDGRALHVTSVEPPEAAPAYPVEPLRGTPCPAPPGGWQVVDPDLTTEQTMNEAFALAARLPDYSQAWMDQSVNPAFDPSGEVRPEEVEKMNDPGRIILNVAVTGDLQEAEAALRETWGGALCVSEGLVTEERRLEIQEALLDEEFGFLGGMGGGGPEPLELVVVHDDGSIQAWLDREHGAGVVEVRSALQPAD